MKHARWGLAGLLLAVALAQTSPVYNYFPVPGITYTASGGMALGSASGGAQGLGTLNAQGLYVNGVAVTTGTGTVTGVTGVTANGFTWSIANPTSTPALTLSTTFTGIGYSNGTGFAAAIASEFPTLNQNTTGNAATATLAATASALAATPSLCASGMVAQGILANGDATGCLTPFSVVNESANTFFAGPPSGTAALPSFRAMVEADLPLSASIFWTGNTTITPSSGVALTIFGAASSDALDVTNGASGYTKVIGSTTTGESNGLEVVAGTNSSDIAFQVLNRAGSTLFSILGNGTVAVSDSAGGGPYQVGYLGTPFNDQGGNYTLSLSDRGKTVQLTGDADTVTIPSGVFVAGDVITLLAFNSTNQFTIAPASGVTLYWAIGNVTTGSRTLTSVGLATILCINSTTFVISGSGIT